MIAVRILRDILGIKQSRLAEQAGISVRTLIRVEQSEVIPLLAIVWALDKAFCEIILERARPAAERKP